MYDKETDSHQFPYYLITGDVFYPKNGFYLLDKYLKSFTKNQTSLFFTFEKDGIEDQRVIDGVDNINAIYNTLNGFLTEERNFRKQAEVALDQKYTNLINALKNKYHAFETDKYYSLMNQDDPNIEIVGLINSIIFYIFLMKIYQRNYC